MPLFDAASSGLPSPPHAPASRSAAAALLAQTNARLSLPLWRAGELAGEALPAAPTGWAALDAALPGGGWPLAGLTELLIAPASGELELLAPWLRRLTTAEGQAPRLLWIAPPGLPCAAALQALGLALPQLVTVTPATTTDAAWAAEQALRSGSCAAVLMWCHGTGHSTRQPPAFASTGLRRLHLAAQAGRTPLMALRPLSARTQSSPAPLRLACAPGAGRQLAVEVFKRRGPPLIEPIQLGLPWPVSVSASVRRSSKNMTLALPHAVDCPAPAAPFAASPALVATGA